MLSQRDKAELGVFFYPVNGGGESSTAGFSTFQTTFTSGVPTTITAGSTYVSLASTNTNVLQGNESDQFICTTATGSTGSGWITDPITLNNADLGKLLQLSFDYMFVSGGTNVSVTGLDASQTLQVWVYNVTAGAWVQPSGYNSINSNGTVPARTPGITFTSTTTASSQYRIAWIIRNAPAGAFTMNIDCITFGRQVDNHGPLVMQGAVSGSVTVNASPVTTNYPLSLPATQGASSSYLLNDGTGQLNWSALPSLLIPPTVQRFTSSGTYTRPNSVLFIEVEVVGGGGGGGGSGQLGTGGGGASGSASSFSSFVSCPGGGGGSNSYSQGVGQGGGLPTVSSPAIAVSLINGNSGTNTYNNGNNQPGGPGGASFFGGSGAAPGGSQGGISATANSGSGGGGGGGPSSSTGGAGTGGASGSYAKVLIPNPAASYSLVIGGGGNGGSPGTNGLSGGSGAAGQVVVTEFYYIPAGQPLPVPKPAAITVLSTAGSGTYSVPSGALWLQVDMVGAGGGGSGGSSSGASNGVAGGNGSASTFGTLLTANGGSGSPGGGAGAGGSPTSATITAPAYGLALNGTRGGGGTQNNVNGPYPVAGQGGDAPYFAGGGAVPAAGNGGNAGTNGGGGSGGGSAATSQSNAGGGGASGAFISAIIPVGSTTSFAYVVGTGGSTGSAGSGGSAGGLGGNGLIVIKAMFQ